MNREEWRKLSREIREWLEEGLREPPSRPRCLECGGFLLFVPKTGFYTCRVCGLEQEDGITVVTKRFLSDAERKKLVKPQPRYETRLRRVLRRVRMILVRLCVESELSYENAGKIASICTSFFGILREKDLIKGSGRTIEKIVFTLFYRAIRLDRLGLLNKLDREFNRKEYQDFLIRTWSATDTRELRKLKEESIERFERNKLYQQKNVELRRALDLLERKFPKLYEEIPKHLQYIFGKLKIPCYNINKIDPTTDRTLDPQLYKLLNLDFFKGVEVTDSEGEAFEDRRKIRYEAVITHLQKVKASSGQLFHSFLQSLSAEQSNKKRKGLACVCTYIAAYLEAINIISFFVRWTGSPIIGDSRSPPFPKLRDKWMQFYDITKATFQKRLNELEKWNPNLIKMVKSWEKVHFRKI